MKVVFCTPTITKPYPQYIAAMEASIPLIQAAGWEEASIYEVGCPYISQARSKMLRKALDAGADVIVFLDHDLSWQPDALLRLIETEGDVVCGTYRYKHEPEEYMGALVTTDEGYPIARKDGCLEAHSAPAGFLKVTREGVNRFIREWPELCYGEACSPHVDLFNHGAHAGVWWGEDYAFIRRWREKCGKAWLIPNLQIDHHSDKPYPGHYSDFLRRQPGGDRAQ